MDALQLIFLAVLQGLTEFLPISSSAHLILLPIWLEWEDQGRRFDVAVHLGCLAAILLQTRSHWRPLLPTPSAGVPPGALRFALWLALATLPLVLFGAAMGYWVRDALRVTWVIGLCNLFFAALLFRADQLRRRAQAQGRPGAELRLHDLGWKHALYLGAFQACAVIPGASRSGVVMTGGLHLGLTPLAAAQLSYLMAIPAILAASAFDLGILVFLQGSAAEIAWLELLLAAAIAGAVAWLAVLGLNRWLRNRGMMAFVLYRLGLGAVLLVAPASQALGS